MINLHYVRTSNGLKVAIMLEETGLEYRTIEYDIFAGDHLRPEFLELNPNQKLPVIVDLAPEDEQGDVTVFETGAILIYLAEKTGQFQGHDARSRITALQWLTWQISGLGPMLGQGYHFARYAPEDQHYGKTRYTREARRLLGVLECRLTDSEFLAGGYSIADMACWPWIQNIGNLQISVAEFPALARWSAVIADRPAVVRAINSPQTSVPSAYLKARMSLTDEQWSNLFGPIER